MRPPPVEVNLSLLSEPRADGLPRWQLDSIYPGLDSAEFRADKDRLKAAVDGLERYFDDHGVSGGADAQSSAAQRAGTALDTDAAPGPVLEGGSARTIEVLEGALDRLEECYSLLATLQPYVGLRIATDAFDELSQAEASKLKPYASRLRALSARFKAWLGGLEITELAAQSLRIKDHEYMLLRAKVESEHLLSDQAEELAAVLDETGGSAWAKLYTNLVSRETIRARIVDVDGGPTASEGGSDGGGAAPGSKAASAQPATSEGEYGLAELRGLQAHAQREVRRRAYEAELRLLRRNAVPFAAAINGIKGQVDELARRRGWGGAFEYSLFQHGITASSLEAMQAACQERFGDLRRYLLTKARLLGTERLAWHDVFAPLPQAAAPRYEWEEAKAFVVERFETYTDGLASFARRAFDENWIDVPPRKGKRNGAFCSAIHPRGESRVMLNFTGNFSDIRTLAHELGHAYHNDCKVRFGRDILQVPTPMTLAETASIFCETVVFQGLMQSTDGAGRLALLEQDLQQVTQLVIDIHSRFLFESSLIERRRERELSVDELDQLMLDAQDATYGETLDPDARHPLMWAHKGHYYSSLLSFYNYPYTFGFLFGLGLYAQYREAGEEFVGRYDELLASTGMADAATLARGFGIDIEDPAFWRSSLDVIARRVDAFEELVNTTVGANGTSGAAAPATGGPERTEMSK